jgi:hypothetical protein
MTVVTIASQSLSVAESAARRVRRAAADVELRLHAWRVALDPDTRRWVEEQRQRHDGAAALDREGVQAHFAQLRDTHR